MRQRTTALLAGLIMAAAGLLPMGAAGAAQGAPGGEPTPPGVPVSEWGSYVVVMQGDPLVQTEGQDNLDTGRARGRQRALQRMHDRALAAVGAERAEKVNDYTVALNGFSATLSHEQAEMLAARKDVLLVLPDELRQPQTDASPDFLGLNDPAGAWRLRMTGEGVVVGVIDTGIWPEHPSFADDGTYPKPPTDEIPCEFGNDAHRPDDVEFDCNNKLIGARQMLATYRAVIGTEDFEFDSARDDDGHGTHTASTAAGNRGVEAEIFGESFGQVSGIAPRAHVVAYKGLGALGGFTSDLAAAINQAVADGVDVINYSIGGGAGAISADDIAFLLAADAGVFTATSAGNSGPGDGTVGSPAVLPWITTVGASTQSRFFQGTVVLGDGRSFTGASVTPGLPDQTDLVDAADAGSELCEIGQLDENVVDGNVVLCKRGETARLAKSEAVQEAGGVGMILYNADDAESLNTDNFHVPTVHTDFTSGSEIRDYIEATAEPTAAIDAWDEVTFPAAPSMASFSSRGPDTIAMDIIKPDVTAPGVQILAGASPAGNPSGHLFQSIAGTSMSSPHVAGLFALLKQAHPDWSPAMAKSAIMTTADPDGVDDDLVTPAGPFDMGSGHVVPGSPAKRGSSFQPGLVYDAGLFEYAAFTCGMEWGVFTAGTCDFLEGEGISTDPSDLNYPSIAVADLAGEQTVTRTVTSVDGSRGWRTFTPKIEAPEGYTVTVSPQRLRLRGGESADYTVTIRNNSAPPGEWRFGSLTWRGKQEVRSPIAVRGALFDAPDEITATGASGTASFDVGFGYTGEYDAAGHGLVPATVTHDTVVQDPDQNLDLGDGFSNAHTFELADVAHLRIKVPPDATEANADLDLFVHDPNGTLVAASTQGGTNEHIDIPDPTNGTWTVYVHGWQAPGGDSEYDMYSWAVPDASGGTLMVTGEPEDAAIGELGTVTVSWDAAGGQWHLGAVSHSDADGVLGLTLVDVDNR